MILALEFIGAGFALSTLAGFFIARGIGTMNPTDETPLPRPDNVIDLPQIRKTYRPR